MGGAFANAVYGDPQKPPALPPPPAPVDGRTPGLLVPGNIELSNRPVIYNADGTHSSEYSSSMGDDKGREVLFPTIVNGKFLTPDGKKPPEKSDAEKAMIARAWQYAKDTGQNMGTFTDPVTADDAANVIHNRKMNIKPAKSSPMYGSK
jgi:hypothetical protein